MQKIIWTLIITLIGLGFAPYKFPADVDKITLDQIVVRPQESTCTPDFRVVNGSLNVPDNLKLLISNVTDLSTTGNNTPSTHLENGGELSLYLDNSYILSGEVVGYDTAFYKDCGDYCALYKVSDWSPLEYYANFWTFPINYFLIYCLTLFTLIITSIVLFVNKIWRRKNK